MGRGVMLSKRVAQVGGPRAIINQELFLAHPVLDPIPPHVHGFGPFLFDTLIGKTDRGGVV